MRNFINTCLWPLIIFALWAGNILTTAAEEPSVKQFAAVIDTPSGRVMKPEAAYFCEILQRQAEKRGHFSVEVFSVEETIDWNAFDTVILYQGDKYTADSPLFQEDFVHILSAWSNASPNRGIILAGGAALLLDRFGFGPIDFTMETFGEDRQETGTIPIQPESAVFNQTIIDRETIWITNAAYSPYVSLTTQSPNVVPLTRSTGSPNVAVLAGLTEANSEDENTPRQAKILVFPWSMNPYYDIADEDFRANTETLLANLIETCGTSLTAFDWTAPEWTLPNFASLERALDALSGDEDYPADAFRAELDALKDRAESITGKDSADVLAADYADLQRRALLANPAIDFDDILFIRRAAGTLGFPENYNSNSSISPTGYDNRIERLSLQTGERSVVFTPPNDEFVGDMELYYDADRFLFSMPDKNNGNRWRVWESRFNSDGTAAAPAAFDLINDGDVDNYDACYLPDGRLIFCSTACFTGVPCINGSGHVCNLYLKENDGSIRQLTVEQDHDWCPTVMNNGRIMYLRWEYTDLPHCYSRILFHMNPDGTNQSELYGSGSYWPEALFYARPIPNDPTRFAAIVTGHHEQPRVGDLVLFDPGIARRETDGAVQRIPGFGKKVQSEVCDLPIGQTWPKFTHPYPIDGENFLVSCRLNAESGWQLALVDIYDNIVPLASEDKYALFEPIPIRPTERPPVIPDRINKKKETADVFIADIYTGRGMAGVERGTVKSIRIISYQFAYQGMGAEPYSVGLDGPWDPKRVIGTVPVNEDGSASFTIPAMTPIAFQPLDAEGKAVQLMRSWVTAMPGESLSCLGCHEEQNETGATDPRSLASQSVPAPITPFYGPERGFSFKKEIQPILDHYCLGCHQPESEAAAKIFREKGIDPDSPDAPFVPDFTFGEGAPLQDNTIGINVGAIFSPSYYQLRRYVRTPTKESQMPTHKPFDFYADSTRLVQLLENGHYGVELDKPSWDRLITWIDLNAPCHGNWGEIRNAEIPDQVRHQYQRRHDLRALYSGTTTAQDDDPADSGPVPAWEPGEEETLRNRRFTDTENPVLFDASASGEPQKETITLSDAVSFDLVAVPGTNFAIQTTEVTNALYALFDSAHWSGIEYGDFINFSPGELGWPLSKPNQPVVRISWNEANQFCRWLSEKTGRTFELPTVEEWELAAKAGRSDYPAFISGDYSLNENLADDSYARINPFSWQDRPNVLPKWRPADTEIDDRSRVASAVASYAPNDWGLYDIIGNAAEWTATDSVSADGTVKKVVAGLSWSAPSMRIGQRRRYFPQVSAYDVGFRVIERKADK